MEDYHIGITHIIDRRKHCHNSGKKEYNPRNNSTTRDHIY